MPQTWLQTKNGISHAVSKHAKIAIIFDRYGMGHREQVEKAMKDYNPSKWGTLPKAVIVISKDGGVHEHHFLKRVASCPPHMASPNIGDCGNPAPPTELTRAKLKVKNYITK